MLCHFQFEFSCSFNFDQMKALFGEFLGAILGLILGVANVGVILGANFGRADLGGYFGGKFETDFDLTPKG